MKRRLFCMALVLLAIGTVGAREAREIVWRDAQSRTTITYRFLSGQPEARPVRMCPENSGRVITLLCPSDAIGCATLGTYGGTGFLVTAPQGTRRVTESICTEPGDNSYFVNATPGNVQCFPESGDSKVVVFSCAGVRVVIN